MFFVFVFLYVFWVVLDKSMLSSGPSLVLLASCFVC